MRAFDEPSSRYDAITMGTVTNLFSCGTFSGFNILLERGMYIEPFPAVRTSDVRWLKIIPYHFLPARRTFHYQHIFKNPHYRAKNRLEPPSALFYIY